VVGVARRSADELPPALSSLRGGGPVAAVRKPEASRDAARATPLDQPMARSFAVTVSAPPHPSLRTGLRGTVRIEVAPRSLFARLRRWAEQTFQFRT
jgi:hypothetical protein